MKGRLWNGRDIVNHIRIKEVKDEPLWGNIYVSSSNTLKVGYKYLYTPIEEGQMVWWWKGVWKFKCPIESNTHLCG